MKNKINIAYGCSTSVIEQLCVSMLSLIEQNLNVMIDFYIIELEFSEGNKNKIIKLFSKYNNINIIFYDCKSLCESLSVTKGYIITSWSKLCLYKIDTIDRVLYLDCDTTIHGNLNDLWNTNLSDYLVAGVEDDASLRWRKLIGLDTKDNYINGGVVLMNLDNWRKQKVSIDVEKYINLWHGDVPFSDQGVLNYVCKDKIKIISPKYDAMAFVYMYKYEEICKLIQRNICSKEEYYAARENPIIIHWVTGSYNRPWYRNCNHPKKHLYLAYYKKIFKCLPEEVNKLPLKSKVIHLLYKITPFSFFYILQKINDNRKYEKIANN